MINELFFTETQDQSKQKKMKLRFTPFPGLTTERLVLRQTTKADCEEILFLRSDKTVNKYIQRATPAHLKDAEAFVNKITKGINNGEIIYWGITLKESAKMIGSICLWNFSSDQKTAETGYDLNPEFQNQGIMSEAMKCVLNFGFINLELEEIEAFTHYENENSKKLLMKNNFRLIEGEKDEGNVNNIVFGISNLAYKGNIIK